MVNIQTLTATGYFNYLSNGSFLHYVFDDVLFAVLAFLPSGCADDVNILGKCHSEHPFCQCSKCLRHQHSTDHQFCA